MHSTIWTVRTLMSQKYNKGYTHTIYDSSGGIFVLFPLNIYHCDFKKLCSLKKKKLCSFVPRISLSKIHLQLSPFSYHNSSNFFAQKHFLYVHMVVTSIGSEMLKIWFWSFIYFIHMHIFWH